VPTTHSPPIESSVLVENFSQSGSLSPSFLKSGSCFILFLMTYPHFYFDDQTSKQLFRSKAFAFLLSSPLKPRLPIFFFFFFVVNRPFYFYTKDARRRSSPRFFPSLTPGTWFSFSSDCGFSPFFICAQGLEPCRLPTTKRPPSFPFPSSLTVLCRDFRR